MRIGNEEERKRVKARNVCLGRERRKEERKIVSNEGTERNRIRRIKRI